MITTERLKEILELYDKLPTNATARKDFYAASGPTTIKSIVEELIAAREVIELYAEKNRWGGHHTQPARAHLERFGGKKE